MSTLARTTAPRFRVWLRKFGLTIQHDDEGTYVQLPTMESGRMLELRLQPEVAISKSPWAYRNCKRIRSATHVAVVETRVWAKSKGRGYDPAWSEFVRIILDEFAEPTHGLTKAEADALEIAEMRNDIRIYDSTFVPSPPTEVPEHERRRQLHSELREKAHAEERDRLNALIRPGAQVEDRYEDEDA